MRGFRHALHLFVPIGVIALGAYALWYVYDTMSVRERAMLLMRVETIAQLISPEHVRLLTGSDADLQQPHYEALKSQLVRLKEVNPDIRFMYLMREVAGEIVFLVDSELESSDDYSPPGQLYEEASAELLRGFEPGAEPVFEVYEDRWGNWMSALAPLRDERGETLALVGIDKNADAHRAAFYLQAGLVGSTTVILLALFAVLYLFHHKEDEVMEMKTDFVAAAAHELRSPLTAIRWSLATLRSNTDLPQSARGTVNDIYDRVRGLIDLTNTFLLSASTDHGVMRPNDVSVVDVTPALSDAVQHSVMFARSKNIHINVTFPLTEKIVLRADAARLRLVFENLLSNAVKYSPVGSTVTVSFEDRRNEKVFRISDQGIGIPPEDQKKIFSGYHRAGNAKVSGIIGSGFGLYMAKKIIDYHHGSISVESSPGQGSTFVVALPSGV